MSNSTVAALQADLKRREATEITGAPVRMPKQQLLDASDTQEKVGPEKHVRWLNMKDPNKVSSRQMEGYVRVPESEGGKALGDEMATFAIPTVKRDARVAAEKEENKRRLMSHKTDMERLAESTAKVLRDKHGITVDPRRLFSDEG